MRWLHRQNVVIVLEHTKLTRQEFFKLKTSHNSWDRNILSVAAEYIAARKIRNKYDFRSFKVRGNIDRVKNTIENYVRKNEG